ncbi:MAG: uL15m family ribosomal protein [Candidatus Aenigmatarchaeota archaeon]
MVVRFRKKVSRQHGLHTHGWGAKKKHRGGGSKGGKGYGGSHKHKFSFITSYDPNHYGYKGFHSSKHKQETIINIGELEKLSLKEGKTELDLASFGYTKLLGKGKLAAPLTVKVGKLSARAKEKIENAGGKIVEE